MRGNLNGSAMPDSPHICDATTEDFQRLVIDGSRERPVLVDFWAAWCGPCQALAPVLARLAEAYGGKFIVVKVDTDQEQELAGQFGVRSLPTLLLFKDGQAVEEVIGAQPESVLRELLDRHIGRDSDAALARAESLVAQGNETEAAAVLQQALRADPANQRIAPALAGLELRRGRVEAARQLMEGMSAEQREGAPGKALVARIGFAEIAAHAPGADELRQRLSQDDSDIEARHLLAARLVLADEPEAALRLLLEICAKDGKWGEAAGRRGMLAVFDVLGDEDELVGRYRREMFNLLH